MQIIMQDLAEYLKRQGFTWKDIDDEKINGPVLEYLDREEFFDKLYIEMMHGEEN